MGIARKMILAGLVAPLWPGLAFALGMTAAGIVSGQWGVAATVESALLLVLIAVPFGAVLGYPVAFTLGPLAVYGLHRQGCHSRRAYAAAAALLGTLVWPELWLFACLTHHPRPPMAGMPEAMAFYAACGAIAGIAFWYQTRPDHTKAPESDPN